MTPQPPISSDNDDLRRAAEERLDAARARHPTGVGVDESMRLLHELQVHQIELEMQNAELQESRATAEAAQRCFTDLYDFAPVGYLTLTPKAGISRLNFAAARLLGGDRAALVGGNFTHFVAEPDVPAFCVFLEHVFASDTRHTCEVTLRRTGIRERTISIEASRVESEGECRIAVTDISDRVSAERAVHRSRALAQSTVDGLQSLICVIDSVGMIVCVNDAWRKLFAYSSTPGAPSLAGMETSAQLGAAANSDRLKAGVRSVLTRQSPHFQTEYEFHTPTEHRWFLARVTRFGDGPETHVIIALDDITRQKNDEARLRQLMHELDHRVRNNLATIAALAQQTLSGSSSLADFEKQFMGRILAIKRTHEALAQVHWHAIDLGVVVRGALQAGILTGQIEIAPSAPEVPVGPRTATALSLTIFELATNAMKYGSLSTSSGRVAVQWRMLTRATGEHQLVFEWSESGGPEVISPTREGFGTILIRDGVWHDLQARADLRYAPEGFRYTLSIPAASLLDPTWA